jgi:hypothetical protein
VVFSIAREALGPVHEPVDRRREFGCFLHPPSVCATMA